jgi:hypothetical protein
MKHLVQINDKTAAGKSVLTMLKAFSDDSSVVKFIEEDSEEETITTDEFFKKLDSEIKKSFRVKKK